MISRVVNDANTENINTKIPIVPYFTMPKAVAAISVVAQEENIATVKLLANIIMLLHSSVYTTFKPLPLFFNKFENSLAPSRNGVLKIAL